MKSKPRFNKWLTAIIIGMAGGLSFELPYLKITYQPSMEFAFGISSTQVGIMMSLYGFLALIFYTPSGLIADKYNHRNLISINLAITGILGFVMALYPPYPVLVLIEVIWAFTTILFMWSATVKSVSLLGGEEEQGALMGLAEGARGFSCLIAAIVTLFVFNRLGADNNRSSFKGVLITYGILMIILAIVCWFIVPDGKLSDKESDASETASAKDVLTVLKMKSTWLCALFVFGIYMSYACLTYTTSYMMDCFGLTMVMATVISILRNQVFRTFCGPFGGLLTIKTPIKSSTKWLQMGAILNTATFVLLVVLPTNNKLLFVIVAIVMMSSFCVYLSRGLYFATVSEVGIPSKISGTAIGVISLIGFIPDAFIYVIIGHWQDSLPANIAYRNLWLTGIAGTVLGIVTSTLLLKEIKKRKESESNTES